jgi:Kdo2-lipid IVA lauroyltransferase/acyltransferase
MISYLIIRFLTFPFSFLPFKVIHFIGRGIGTLAYYTLTKYRKRALSNLSLARIPDIKKTAKASFQNLAITCLEYVKFSFLKNTEKILHCENPETAQKLIDQKTGIIFFCGHQANWELLFLEGTRRMPGVAIGRPIKNKPLYDWIISIREKFGGKIIPPKRALKEGLRALRQGKFFGILGDQGMPESDYAFEFFGRRAWTTPTPAILSYKTKCPIIVATIKREKGKYLIHYSDPIWPNLDASLEEEIYRMMKESLLLLEEKIRETPDQWLWQHNRWKQDTPLNVYYRYRWDSILLIMQKKHLHLLPTFREIYPKAFLTVFVPKNTEIPLSDVEIHTYENESELFITDHRFKMVFNFSGNPHLNTHFLKQSAFHCLDLPSIKKAASEHLTPNDDLSLILKKALTRPNTLWNKL